MQILVVTIIYTFICTKTSLDFMHDLMHSGKMKEKTERSISQSLMIMFSKFAQW